MVLSTVLSFARAQVQTDTNGLTNANGIIFANEALEDFHRRLVSAGVDAAQLQESDTSGTVNTGTYLYPTDMIFLKAIELNYANTTQQDYKKAEQVDISNLPAGSYDWLRVNGSEEFPQFDDRGDWFEVFPTPTASHNVTNLIKIFYFKKPTQYATVSDTVAYPESLDQTLLGWRICASYLYSLRGAENIAAGDAFNAKYEQRVKDYISTLSRGTQQPIQATTLQIDGFQF